MSRALGLGVLLACLSASATGARQTSAPAPVGVQATAPGTITGRIVSATTGEGVIGASVGLRCTSPTSVFSHAETQSDANGDFSSQVQPGRCLLLTNPPFVGGRPTWQPEELMRPYDVEPGETVRVERRMIRLSSFEGRVVDVQGNPIVGVPVCPVRLPRVAGELRCIYTTSVLTDSKGLFRFDSVGAGRFGIVVPSLTESAPVPEFDLAAGQHRTDLEVRAPRRPTHRLVGQLQVPEGFTRNVRVRLEHAESPITWSMVMAETDADAQGRFVFPRVPEGAYRVRVDTTLRMPGADPPDVFWGHAVALVSSDVDDLSLQIRRGVEIRGEATIDGAPAQAGRSIQFLFSRVIGGASGRVRADGGRFVTRALAPNHYTIQSALGGLITSVLLNGRDVTEETLDLTGDGPVNLVVNLTDRLAEVSGVVRDAVGGEDGAATVLFFPSDTRLWPGTRPDGINTGQRRVRTAPTTQRGRFSLSGLPAGEYLAAAVWTGDLRGATDDRYAHLAPLATRFVLDAGAHVTINLRRVELPR